jgi:sugar phosphate isomerase/epimerase
MLHLRVGVQLASLRQPFKKALDWAADLGAEAIEIDARHEIRPHELSRTAVRQIRTMLNDRRLKVCSVRFQTRRGYQVVDDLDRRVDATKQAMEMAYELGAPIVCNSIGSLPDEPQGAEWDLMLQVLTDLGRFGQKCGAMLAATTGGLSPETLQKLLEMLPKGSLLVDFDPAELIIHRQSPSDAVARLAHDVAHFRMRDAVQDFSQGRGVEVQVGRGAVDFPELLGKLEERQYSGYLTVQRNDADEPRVEIQQAIEFMRNLWT